LKIAGSTRRNVARRARAGKRRLTSPGSFPILDCVFGIGVPELLIILVIVVVIFGASRLPQIGEGLGRGIRNFRGAMKEPPEIDVTPPKQPAEPEEHKR
jgi:sec-independent protein translocase protein TatA